MRSDDEIIKSLLKNVHVGSIFKRREAALEDLDAIPGVDRLVKSIKDVDKALDRLKELVSMKYKEAVQNARKINGILRADDSRFGNTVYLSVDDGSSFTWRNAFAGKLGNYYAIFTEHHGFHVYAHGDVISIKCENTEKLTGVPIVELEIPDVAIAFSDGPQYVRVGEGGVTAIESMSLTCGCRVTNVHRCKGGPKNNMPNGRPPSEFKGVL